MALKKRLLRIQIKLPSQTLVLDEELYLSVRVKKATLSLQSKATIDVGGLSQSLRKGLLSQFTAFRKRLKDTEGVNADDYLDVVILAGYEDASGVQTISPIFHGQVVLVEPMGLPPDITVRITAYTNQVDRTTYVTEQPPSAVTFKAFCTWCAGKMNLTPNISTSIDNTIIYNPAARTYIVAGLLPWIQAYDRQSIAAWIDDDTLYVRDIGSVVNKDSVIRYDTFVGPPMWTEWGINFRTMFDSRLTLASAAKAISKTNPSIADYDLIVMQLEYDLSSRADPFCINVTTAPSA